MQSTSYFTFFIPTKVNLLQAELYYPLYHSTLEREKRRKQVQLLWVPFPQHTYISTHLFLLCSHTSILTLAFLHTCPFPCVLQCPICVSLDHFFKDTGAIASNLQCLCWYCAFSGKKTPRSSSGSSCVYGSWWVRGVGRREQTKKGYVLNISVRNQS